MIRRFIEQAWLNYKGEKVQFQLEEFLLLDAGMPFLSMVSFCLLAGFSFRTMDITRWIVGNAFLLCMNGCFFSLGTAFMRERYSGRIRSLIASPANRLGVVMEKGVFTCIESIFTTILGFTVGCMVFRIDMSKLPIAEIALLGIVSIFAVGGLGLFLSVIGMASGETHFILNFASTLLTFFSGAEFPLSQLPSWTSAITRFVPMASSIKGVEILLAGGELKDIWLYLLWEMVLGILYFLGAAVLIRYVERLAIRKAALELF